MYFIFQPIYDIQNNVIYGYEALLRNADYKNISKYIDKQLYNSNDYYLEFYTLFKSQQEFLEQGIKGKIFVNSLPSISLTAQDYELLKELFDLKNVVLEILEYPSYDTRYMPYKIDFFKSQNSLIAIDDYGFDSCIEDKHIIEIQPDFIKIDKDIIRDIHKDIEKQELVEKIIDFSKDLRADVIAEGIETVEELNYIKRLDVKYGQGFLFKR